MCQVMAVGDKHYSDGFPTCQIAPTASPSGFPHSFVLNNGSWMKAWLGGVDA